MKKLIWIVAVTILLTGCKAPLADVAILMMPAQGVEPEIAEQFEETLVGEIGETPSIFIHGAPMFMADKLLVEIAAGSYDILLIPKTSFVAYAEQQGFVPLDDIFDPELYPEGVVDVVINSGEVRREDAEEIRETNIYGIPVHQSQLLTDAGYNEHFELYAAILIRANSIEQSKQVLKLLAE